MFSSQIADTMAEARIVLALPNLVVAPAPTVRIALVFPPPDNSKVSASYAREQTVDPGNTPHRNKRKLGRSTSTTPSADSPQIPVHQIPVSTDPTSNTSLISKTTNQASKMT